MESILPKYYLIKNDIIKKVNNEDLSDHQPLPSERELIETYNVSRITVRRAIDELVKEGYAYKIKGKGSFVKGDNKKQPLNKVYSYTEEILNQGMKPYRVVLNSEVRNADVKKCKHLNLNTDEKLFVLERIYFGDDEPLCVTKTYLPYKYFASIECFDFKNNSLYTVLENFYNIKITRASQTIEACSSNAYISPLLNVSDGHPLLLFKTITYALIDGVEIPFEYFESYYNTTKIKYSIEQVR